MQSEALSVKEYVKESPLDRQDALIKLRQIFLDELKDYSEIMRYGNPCYEKNGVVEAGFASQKNFIGVYILKKEAMDKFKNELKGVSFGKGSIRFTKAANIDYDVIRKMLSETYRSNNIICG